MFETYSPQTLRSAIETELQNNPNLNAKAAAMIAMKRLGDNPFWYDMNKAKNLSKLTKKVITNKKGHQQTVYVKTHEDEKKNDSWLNGIMSFFGFSDKKQVFKKLDEDYKSHDMGRKFNLTWDSWKSHVSAYFDNKEKWDKFFSGKHEGKGSGKKKESKEKKEKKTDKKKSPLRLSVMKEIFSMYGGAKPEMAVVPVQTIEPVKPVVTENNFETMPESDPSRVQEIKNSIAEGELIIKTGMINGRKLSMDEIQAVQKSIDNAKKRIGLNTPPVLPPHLQSIADKQKGFTIDDVTPKGFGPDKPETDTIPETPEQKAKDKKVSKKIKAVTPETRNETEREIAGIPEPTEEKLSELEDQVNSKPFEPIIEPLSFPFASSGTETVNIKNYYDVPAKSIFLISQKDILSKPKPSYIPDMDERFFREVGHIVPAYKLSENKYVMQISKKREVYRNHESIVESEDAYVIVNRDVLAATQDYFLKLAKGKLKQGEDEYEKKHNVTLKKRSRITVKNENSMTYTQQDLILKFIGKDRAKVWASYWETRKDLKQKLSDMEIQIEESYNTYFKGVETSYGDSGTKDNLLSEYGVKVKRQNGAEINDSEIKDVKLALDDVYSVFGNRSSMSKNFGLKISHSGDVLMHARKAAGLFFPSMKAIGVTAQSGKKAMGFILAHEFGHFMDYYLGSKDSRHYASDNPESLAGNIATIFRKKMKKTQASDYQNRTCECFARAMEQYWAIKTNEIELLDQWNSGDNHPDKETFMEKIYPLCERFFTENNELLKAMKIPFYIKRKDGNGKTIYVKGQTK